MRHCIIITLLHMVFGILNGFGQHHTPTPVYLSNYSFSKEKQDVGYVQTRSANGIQVKSVSIEGAHAKAFRLGTDLKLVINPHKIQPGIKWLDLILKVETSEGVRKDTFRIVRDLFIHNKVIAHRGAWKNTGAAENSISALQHAIALGCEGSEFDVHMSSDSIPFINHDADIQGVPIATTTSSRLVNIKLSNGETLPTLENYIMAGMNQNRTKLILEIKASPLGKESSIVLTHKVVEGVEKLHAQAWVDYICFDYDVCKEIMKIAPYAKVAYLNGDKTPAELAQDGFYGLDYHYSVLQKNEQWVREAQQKNLTVNAWTVNDKATMEWLLQQEVEFITTNEPELLLNLVSGK